MNALLRDLIIDDYWFELPYFESQEELNKYVGEEVPVKFDNDDEISDFIDKWKKRT